MSKKTPHQETPPELLRKKQPIANELGKMLGLSRFHAYGLLNPNAYPSAIPVEIFDVRSELGPRIARFVGKPVTTIRNFYAKWKPLARR